MSGSTRWGIRVAANRSAAMRNMIIDDMREREREREGGREKERESERERERGGGRG